MKDAERIAELEAALRRSELLVEQLQSQLRLRGRALLTAQPQTSAEQSVPAGEREAIYMMRRTDETAWHVTTFQTFEHIASGKSPQHEAVKLYTAPQPAPAQDVAGLVKRCMDEEAAHWTGDSRQAVRLALDDAYARVLIALAAHDKQSSES